MIALTYHYEDNSTPILVNPDHIVCVTKSGKGAMVSMVSGESYRVAESMETILGLVLNRNTTARDVAKVRELLEKVIAVEPLRRNGHAVQVQQ